MFKTNTLLKFTFLLKGYAGFLFNSNTSKKFTYILVVFFVKGNEGFLCLVKVEYFIEISIKDYECFLLISNTYRKFIYIFNLFLENGCVG